MSDATMIFTVEVRNQPWPDGEPLDSRDVSGSRAAARGVAQELLRSLPDATLADVRLRWALIDQYAAPQAGRSRLRHLYAAPMRARRAS